jgi:2C-methyl-D-erythritol 2,4-cyclodiphosphate synthase
MVVWKQTYNIHVFVISNVKFCYQLLTQTDSLYQLLTQTDSLYQLLTQTDSLYQLLTQTDSLLHMCILCKAKCFRIHRIKIKITISKFLLSWYKESVCVRSWNKESVCVRSWYKESVCVRSWYKESVCVRRWYKESVFVRSWYFNFKFNENTRASLTSQTDSLYQLLTQTDSLLHMCILCKAKCFRIHRIKIKITISKFLLTEFNITNYKSSKDRGWTQARRVRISCSTTLYSSSLSSFV